MQKVMDMTNDTQREAFQMCLDRLKNCNAVVTLRQYLYVNETKRNEMVVDSLNLTECRCEVFFTDGIVYLDMHIEAETAKNIKRLWLRSLKNNSNKNLNGKVSDMALVIDLVKTEAVIGEPGNELAYIISLFKPTFLSLENENGDTKNITLLYSPNNFYFGIEEVHMEEVEYEELEEAGKKMDDFLRDFADEEEYDENDSVIGNDEFINNDDFLDV